MESPRVSKLKSIYNKLTTNIDRIIDFLKSEDSAVLEQALNSLLIYSAESRNNASILFRKDILQIFTDLLKTVNTKNLTLILKILLRITKDVPECVDHIIHTKNTPVLCEINQLFLMTNDEMVQELSANLLSNVRMDVKAAHSLLTTDVVSTIFARLETVDDAYTLKSSLIQYLHSLLIAKQAKNAFNDDNLPIEVFFHYIKIPMFGVQNTTFDILDILISWKSYAVLMLLRRAKIVENMLNYIMDEDHKLLHDRAFKLIYDCCESDETGSYFIRSKEFMVFRRWSTTCGEKYIFFSAAFMTLLTANSLTREKLIRCSIGDTVLSYIRSKDLPTFYKNCQMFCNLMRSPSCPLAVIEDNVICYMLKMLQRDDPELFVYHEMAMKTLLFFLISRVETLEIFIRNNGIIAIYKVLKNWEHFTNEGLISALRIIYVLSTSANCKFTPNRSLYGIIINCFSKSSVELCKRTLLVLDIYLKDPNCLEYFIELDGPKILVKKLRPIIHEELYQRILTFIYHLIMIDSLGRILLLQTDLFPTLNSIDSIFLHRFPKIRQILHLLCELHHELNFYYYGFLPPEVVCDYGFYIINDMRGFCFIENMLENCASPFYTMYIVNFVGPPIKEVEIELEQEQEPSAILSFVSQHTGCTSCSFSTKLRTKLCCNLCNKEVDESPSIILPVGPPKPVKAVYGYGYNLKEVNYGTISPDPYLSNHVKKLADEMASSSLIEKIQKLAQYVTITIREPISVHEFSDHIRQLKVILGTSIIPIGYVHCGYECERALLYKALADKLNLPVSLNKERSRRISYHFMYWNEIGNEYNENYIIDLMGNVGDLIQVGHPKAYEYCGRIDKRQRK